MSARLMLSEPVLQTAFASKLDAARGEILQEALLEIVRGLEDNAAAEAELAHLADSEAVKILAGERIRGEIAFTVPTILRF